MPLALFLFFHQAEFAEKSTMDILLNGSKCGTAEYRREESGKFSGKANLAVGTVKILSTIEGTFKANVLDSFKASVSNSGSDLAFTFADSKLTLQGKSIPLSLKDRVLFGNLIPQLSSSLAASVNFDDKTPQKRKLFLPDGGSLIDATITPGQSRAVKAGRIRFFTVKLPSGDAEVGVTDKGKVVSTEVKAQLLKWIDPAYTDIFRDQFAGLPELSQPTSNYKVLTAQKMSTRDGVTLVQDVYVPAGEGKFPVILMRTPYGRAIDSYLAPLFVKRGYVMVCQDVRGRNDSDGKWDPFVNERKDGYDAIDWISKQPWCDGKVGMIGGSYGGYVQWAAAVEGLPALKCIIPQVSPPDAMRNLPYEYGVFMLFQDLWWAKIVADKKADFSTYKAPLGGMKNLTHLPLSEIPQAVLGREIPFWNDWLTRTTSGSWIGWDHTNDIDKVKIPVLSVSGWWDGDGIGTKLHVESMNKAGKKNQWLIYGPWSHAFNMSTKIGDVEYGPTAIIDIEPSYVRFFDTYLKGKSVNWEKTPRAKIFVTGANQWRNLSEWPGPDSKEVSYYLGRRTERKNAQDFGELSPVQTRARMVSTKYTYDPKADKIDPKMLEMDETKASTQVANPAENPSAMFRSEVLKQPMTITGPIDLDLFISTSAEDTDFFATLVDIDEKGVGRAVGGLGKIRASYRSGLDKQVALKPGKVEKVTLRLWDTAHEFKVGHRLSLVVSSSIFPMSARNLGTLDPIATATRIVVQKNVIEHSAVYPSALRFRVMK